ncbi:AAA family ATPase [Candidatus Nitrosotenuis chungbukensis]|uniref:AAA family ATPase n=1 Tax=Candidatus Nitrosotenuis chungbukensis TaxID=1353246 RepID=UPI0005B2B6A2|nr:SMC family ATPase [Candidatus Nitrosotenuis chungbukensis]
MITSVELGNFISHSETKIDFEEGVTVFVGHNGAGKSSIIDAITFALFGEHTRKSNKSLIRRGTSQAYSKVSFTLNGKQYQAERKIDSKGTLGAQLFEIRNGETLPIASGERKQFGESMTGEIESRIGLDFTKLKVASIVQQGELNSIIKAKPKEFKELLNAIIGIDKLDTAAGNLKIVQKNFRQAVQQRLGYDDTHIDILNKEITTLNDEIKSAEPQKADLLQKKVLEEAELQKIKQKIETESPKKAMLAQIEQRKSELVKYAKDAILLIQKNISEKERKIQACQGCFEYADSKGALELSLQKTESEIEGAGKKIQELSKQVAVLKEHESLAKKLQLQDGKCPVCDSAVDRLKPIFQIEHLRQEQQSAESEIHALEQKKLALSKEKKETSEKLQKAIAARSTLDAHSIQNAGQIEAVRKEVDSQKAQISALPTVSTEGGLLQFASVDSHARTMYDTISDLEKQVSGFNQKEFEELKTDLEQKQKELSQIDQKYGAITEKIKRADERVAKISSILSELSLVRKYLLQIDDIQSSVYDRDGPVATSLRSWALMTISAKASEYLDILNTKIHRVELSEKTRDITITCYSKNSQIDIDSLSGGEQVSVALSLRLGMAHLLGASNLNFIILDEPTTHLDGERRRALVRVLSQLSDITGVTGPLQFIIITHDAEIFEDSSVEKIYKFESGENGTKVALL